jgi:hypothetical protein
VEEPTPSEGMGDPNMNPDNERRGDD